MASPIRLLKRPAKSLPSALSYKRLSQATGRIEASSTGEESGLDSFGRFSRNVIGIGAKCFCAIRIGVSKDTTPLNRGTCLYLEKGGREKDDIHDYDG